MCVLLESHAHVKVHPEALCIVVLVGELGSSVVLIVETSLLITTSLDVSVVEQVVKTQVEVK